MKMKKLLYIGIVLLMAAMVDSCVDPVNIATQGSVPQLVVEGYISDSPGPYKVRLFHSTRPDTVVKDFQPESAAIVTIHDNAGNAEVLQEVSPGNYETQAGGIQGVAGRTYHLTIKTKTGNEYESTPEVLPAGGTIDSVYYEYFLDRIKNPDPTSLVDLTVDGFNVYADAHGPAGATSYTRWIWEGTYKVHTYPEKRYKSILANNGRENDIPDPVPCSGYIAVTTGPVTAKLVEVGPCTCCTCWVRDLEKFPLVLDNQLVNDQQFKRVGLTSVKITDERFYDKYYINVTLMSLTKPTMDFWRQIRAQKEGASSLFQPPSGKITGNIKLTKGTDPVIGIFYAAAVDTKSIWILPANVPASHRLNGMRSSNKKYFISCLDFDNSTTTQPSFWE